MAVAAASQNHIVITFNFSWEHNRNYVVFRVAADVFRASRNLQTYA